MIRNEEYWIEAVLRPLVNVFPVVIVGDTASTDRTPEIIKQFEKIHFVQLGNADPVQVGVFRENLQHIAADHGATHAMLVDGDEIYIEEMLRYIIENTPADMVGGFPSGVNICERSNGELFESVRLCRHSIFPVTSKWRGTYPYESPDTYLPGNPKNFYYKRHDEKYQFYHMQQTARSPRDCDCPQRIARRNEQAKYHTKGGPTIAKNRVEFYTMLSSSSIV